MAITLKIVLPQPKTEEIIFSLDSVKDNAVNLIITTPGSNDTVTVQFSVNDGKISMHRVNRSSNSAYFELEPCPYEPQHHVIKQTKKYFYS